MAGSSPPGFRTPVRNELPKRDAPRFPFFPPPFRSILTPLTRARRASSSYPRLPRRRPPYIRGNYEATDSSCLAELHVDAGGRSRGEGRGGGKQHREDISGYGDFYVPILIHAGTTRRMARYFLRATAFRASGTLKSMRAACPTLPRSPPLPPFCLSLSVQYGRHDLSRTGSYHRVETPTRLFDGRYRRSDNVLPSARRGTLIVRN